MIRTLYVLFAVLTAFAQIHANRTVLGEVLKPDAIAVSSDYLYVIEETSILIYKLSDLSFQKRFGKAGEGPMEFSRFVVVTPAQGRLWINSMGKLSVFSALGEFIEQKKSPGQFRTQLLPLGDGFVGRLMQRGEGSMRVTLALFDKDLNKTAELDSLPFAAQGGGPGGGGRPGSGPGAGASLVFPSTPFLMATSGSHAAVAAWDDFRLQLIGERGKAVKIIERKGWPRPKLTATDRKEYEASLKRRFGTRWPRMRERIQYAEFYPALAELFFDGSDLIVTTWKRENDKTVAYRYKTDGQDAGELRLSLHNQSPLERYPLCLGNGHIYQLVENEDEEWELHVTLIR